MYHQKYYYLNNLKFKICISLLVIHVQSLKISKNGQINGEAWTGWGSEWRQL